MTVEFIAIMLCLVVPLGSVLLFLYFAKIREDKNVADAQKARDSAARKYREQRQRQQHIWDLEHELLEDYAPVQHPTEFGAYQSCNTCIYRQSMRVHDKYLALKYAGNSIRRK